MEFLKLKSVTNGENLKIPVPGFYRNFTFGEDLKIFEVKKSPLMRRFLILISIQLVIIELCVIRLRVIHDLQIYHRTIRLSKSRRAIANREDIHKYV